MKKRITQADLASSCYFRTSVETPYRKAIVQVTERCNLHCAHCFVSATKHGDDISIAEFEGKLIPRLLKSRVVSVTLTGGEPFAHAGLIEMVQMLRKVQLPVSICTNATLITDEQINQLVELKQVGVNVSLDGFSRGSHGRFRGAIESFDITKNTIERLGKAGILKGILVTPNKLTDVQEYTELCQFATINFAQYVLMNPLSDFGRGIKSRDSLQASEDMMNLIRDNTRLFASNIDLSYIRFPNTEKPLSACEAGNILYVFAHGEITICPYLVFAAKNPHSVHQPEEFIVGNILADENIAIKLDEYHFHDRYSLGDNHTCSGCYMNSKCGKGCPASVIASGQRIEGLDREQCPIVK